MKLYQQLRDMFADTHQTSANGNLCESRTGQYFPFRDRIFTFYLNETANSSAQLVDGEAMHFDAPG